MDNKKIKLSIVVTARNDNYGGDFIQRLNIFQKVLTFQVEKLKVPVELIIVEWNPLPDRARLKEAVVWTEKRQFLKIRIITVPEKLHGLFPNKKKTPVLEYPGKNVGIRRAAGEFVLTTNPDIIFSDTLADNILKKSLDKDSCYRVDRYDYNVEFDNSYSAEKVLKNIEKNLIRCYTEHSWFPMNPKRVLLNKIMNDWPRSFSPYGIKAMIQSPVRAFRTMIFRNTTQFMECFHQDRAGDFILTAKNNWEKICGFAEIYDTFTKLDTVCCYQLLNAGIRFQYMPHPNVIYHYDHDRSIQEKRQELENFSQIIENLCENADSCQINSENWGLKEYNLQEVII